MPNKIEPKYKKFEGKTNKLIEMQKVLNEKFDDCDDLLMLQIGLVFGKQQKVGEFFIIDFESDQLKELQTTYGCTVTYWTSTSYDSIAFASNGQIVVAKFQSNKEAVVQIILNTSKDDFHHDLCYTDNQLFPINKNAVVTSIKTFKFKFCPGVYSLITMNLEIIIATHKVKKYVILLNINLQKQFFYKARVKQLMHCYSNLNQQILAVVQEFSLINRYILLKTNQNSQEERSLTILKLKTIMFLNDSTIQTILKISRSVNPLLVKMKLYDK